jgi:hypothetical protein
MGPVISHHPAEVAGFYKKHPALPLPWKRRNLWEEKKMLSLFLALS